jgi:cell division protein FtsB
MSQLELDPVLVTPLRRPRTRARKRTARVPAGQPKMLRTALWIVAGATVFAFAGRIGAFAMEPLAATWRTEQEIRELRDATRKETAVNEQLRRDIAYLSTQAGVEQEARRRGWVRPGEVALSIVRPEPEVAPATEPKAEPIKTASASISDRIQSVLDTCLSVFGGTPRTR